MAITFTQEGRTNCWDFIAGPNGSYLEIHLYSNVITWTDGTTLAMLTECNYGGYAPAKNLAWSAPVEITGGDVQIQSPVYVFTHGPASDSGTAAGYYIMMNDGTGPFILGGEAFANPVPMNTPTSQLPLQVALSLRALLA